jgi:phosphomethylpyrimidine synthase
MGKDQTQCHTNHSDMVQIQVELAAGGVLTRQVKDVAKTEHVPPDVLMGRVARGSVVIMTRGEVSVGIGEGLRTKVNVNLGTSSVTCNPQEEVKKAIIAGKYGADTISDLSMGGSITNIRKAIFENSCLPITTVPMYQACAEQGIKNLSWDHILDAVRMQALEGVSSFVFHCVSKEMLSPLVMFGINFALGSISRLKVNGLAMSQNMKKQY